MEIGESTAQTFFTQATDAYEIGQYQRAELLARFGLHHASEDGRLWVLLGKSRWMLKDPRALNALETASCLIPLDGLAELALAQCYLQLGKPDLARGLLLHIPQTNDCPVSHLHKVASALGHLGEYETALHVCETILAQNPEHHAALFGVAYYRGRLGASLDTLVWPLAKAMALAPHILSYRMNSVSVWMDSQEWGKAYDLLKAVPVEAVTHPCWLNRMLALYKHYDDLDRCQACLEQMERLGLCPTPPQAC